MTLPNDFCANVFFEKICDFVRNYVEKGAYAAPEWSESTPPKSRFHCACRQMRAVRVRAVMPAHFGRTRKILYFFVVSYRGVVAKLRKKRQTTCTKITKHAKKRCTSGVDKSSRATRCRFGDRQPGQPGTHTAEGCEKNTTGPDPARDPPRNLVILNKKQPPPRC